MPGCSEAMEVSRHSAEIRKNPRLFAHHTGVMRSVWAKWAGRRPFRRVAVGQLARIELLPRT